MSTRTDLRAFALTLPEAFEDFPWEDDAVVKVNKKIFLFLGSAERATGFGVKLVVAHGHALSVPGAIPSRYGLGRSGWVTVPYDADLPEFDVLQDWVEESYRLVAPKRLSKLL
ncbi:MmcQ/YjbR family DNA-binding protein [Herbidospora daliensis]|uniref:MmcQ/YjbR family DNA-binding protein n=1 Tax=Herbidospora daliensis TaxID=295585 RepID=UPI0007813302|nr:MmcQ/YjbR family DNA-binding protein [Herbidospora daliensis]